MATDMLVSRELKSLQDELASARKDRSASAAQSAAPAAAPISPGEASPPAPDEAELQDYLRQLADEVTDLFGEAGKSISAHPAQSLAGALVLGILIGRLLGRR